MSKLTVETVEIADILQHEKADKLEIAVVKGWQCIVQKGFFKKGDIVVYIPIDSILPEELEKKIFGPDSKISLHKHRVKTIKIRGVISQGLVINLGLAGIASSDEPVAGLDITEKLGIKKYEPDVPDFQKNMFKGRVASKKEVNPHFHKYTDIANIKNFLLLFEPDEIVVATEKIHGTNFRAGYVPFVPVTIWEKVKAFFGFAPEFQFVFGSHNVQLQHKMLYDGFFDSNVYANAVKDYKLDKILKHGEVVYGEIYGDGIQKNYNYGLKDKKKALVVFDIMQDGAYLNRLDFLGRIKQLGLPTPPELYYGPYKDLDIARVVDGDSVFCIEQKVKEGAVIKPIIESRSYNGGSRKILKAINPQYLLKDNSDFH